MSHLKPHLPPHNIALVLTTNGWWDTFAWWHLAADNDPIRVYNKTGTSVQLSCQSQPNIDPITHSFAPYTEEIIQLPNKHCKAWAICGEFVTQQIDMKSAHTYEIRPYMSHAAH